MTTVTELQVSPPLVHKGQVSSKHLLTKINVLQYLLLTWKQTPPPRTLPVIVADLSDLSEPQKSVMVRSKQTSFDQSLSVNVNKQVTLGRVTAHALVCAPYKVTGFALPS